jgi:hypothetical protein
MARKVAFLFPIVLGLAACNSTGGLKVPFTKEKPFVPTAVPADFAVVVDENHDTYYARQHIRQRVSMDDAMSQTTYTTRRDYNNSISNSFSQETPLSPVQLQNMWNDVSRYNLMAGSSLWINWRSDADIYRRNSYTLQIRANGRTRTYTATNGFSGNLRPLILQVEAVRLPITQNSNTRVIGQDSSPEMTPGPAMPPAGPMPRNPDMSPATRPGQSSGIPAAPSMDGSPAADGTTTRPLSAGQSDGAVRSDTITIERATPPAAGSRSGATGTGADGGAVTPRDVSGSSSGGSGTYSQMKTPAGNPADAAPAAPSSSAVPPASTGAGLGAPSAATEPSGYHQLNIPPR